MVWGTLLWGIVEPKSVAPESNQGVTRRMLPSKEWKLNESRALKRRLETV